MSAVTDHVAQIAHIFNKIKKQFQCMLPSSDLQLGMGKIVIRSHIFDADSRTFPCLVTSSPNCEKAYQKLQYTQNQNSAVLHSKVGQ